MNSHRYHSLAARLSLWIVSLGAIIFISVLSTNYFLSRFLLEDYVSDLAATTTSSTIRKIETRLQTVSSNADSLAAVIANAEVSKKQIHQAIKAILNTNPTIFGMTVALEPHVLIDSLGDFSPYYYRNDNDIAFSDLADSRYQYRNWPWYSGPRKSNAPLWSEPYLDEGGGNVFMVTYSTPIYLAEGKTFAGVATADINLNLLDEIVEQIKVGETGYGFILSSNDIVIAHPDKSLNMTRLDETNVKAENWKRYLESKSDASSAYFKTLCYEREEHCWIAIETLGNTGWKVIVVIPEQEMIAKINQLTLNISIIAVTGLLILVLVIVLVTRHLTKPLNSLAIATRDIGSGNLDAELPVPVRKDEIGSLTTDFSSMRRALKKYITRVQEATARQQKLESEIQIARDIQMSMIPGGGNVSITQDNFQLYSLLRPARSVGGDLYYYQQNDETLHFIIGDVSDKGIPAALFMAKTVTLYTRALKDKLLPGQTLTMMNDILVQNNDACMFVTALCGSINLDSGEVLIANAGHMNPVIKDNQHTSELEVNGATALGLMEGVVYEDIEFTLKNNTSLIMYTDGISEAHDIDENQYTDERLLEFITSIKQKNAADSGNKIIESVDNFAADTEQFDDITLLIFHYE